jgi:hypothetical protein
MCLSESARSVQRSCLAKVALSKIEIAVVVFADCMRGIWQLVTLKRIESMTTLPVRESDELKC